MHTVSLFPSFLDYQILGIFMLRVALGFIFISFWYSKTKHDKKALVHFIETLGVRRANTYLALLSYVVSILGVLLFVGLWTQGVAIATGILMSIATIFAWRKPNLLRNTTSFYFLLAVASFSLLFLGAGAFAVDWML